MKNLLTLILIITLLSSCNTGKESSPQMNDGDMIRISQELLQDKIKGAWAGQTIGVTYGGPTEFRFRGTMIQDYIPIPWYEGVVKWWYENAPGLYDDIYMDLTFVDVFDRLGLDAPADSFAMAFATADYMLWHANQAARVNILNGIMPPESGQWLNNPHADCIDYQIEADFSGIMSPGMINTASEISDKIGHIMNYGDGWYGGVYVGAMYSLAFLTDDIEYIVKEALKTIPLESSFYQCVNEVIENYYRYPDDWKQTWFEVEKNWTEDVGCPEGVLQPFNIDAKVNAAYIVIGLLYGEGDFSKTLDISTRCGQDSDCNPASAGGILGTILGYANIPEYWKKELIPVESMDFKYTTISLEDTYSMSYEQALELIKRNGGEVNGNEITIQYQAPEKVRFEQGFKNLYPINRENWGRGRNVLEPEFSHSFTGTGFVIEGSVEGGEDYIAECEVFIDDVKAGKVHLPASYTTRSPEFFWNYSLEKDVHHVRLVHLNPVGAAKVHVTGFITYSDQPYHSDF